MHHASRTIRSRPAILALAAALALSAAPTARADDGPAVELTWMSIANWYFKVGGVGVLMDGYITRVPGPPFFYAPDGDPGDVYGLTRFPWLVDVTSVSRVYDAMRKGDDIDVIIAGHSHFDHTWDTPTWAKLSGAPIIGGLSTCYQAAAQGVSRCTVVNGGERISLAKGVTMRVVRWNHSGNATNPIQHFARELAGPPVPDPVTQGLRAGVGEDYPNGGGGRAYLFTVERGNRRLSFFVNNSASAFDLDQPIVVDGVSYGAPIDNLAAAMRDAGLSSVDVWIGTGGAPVAQLVVPVLHPKAYVPNHWDGLFNPFWAGMPFPFKDAALSAYLGAQGIPLLPQGQYFDTYRLTASGVAMKPNDRVKRELGFADPQPFAAATLELTRRSDRTASGDDCGE